MKSDFQISQRLQNATSIRTNAMFWKDVNSEDVLEFYEKSHFPERLLQPLIHEATHYWCFNSPVGRAIQVFWFDFLSRAMKFSYDEKIDLIIAEWGSNGFATAIDDKVSMEAVNLACVENCLNPIIEGLALFAEFDYCPPPHLPRKHGSFLLRLCGLIYAFNTDPAIRQRINSMRPMSEYIRNVKLAQNIDQRKGNILCLPINPANLSECYLLAYLMVKDIYGIAFEQSHGECDPEFFITYLRAYIFEDWSLVSHLLEANKSTDGSSIFSILGYVTKRLENLKRRGLWKDMLEYEDGLLRGMNGKRRSRMDWETLPGLQLTDDQVHKGQKALEQSKNSISRRIKHPLFQHIVEVKQFTHSLLKLFEANVEVEVDRSGNATVQAIGNESGRSIIFPGCEKRMFGDGTLSAYLSDQAQPLALVWCLRVEGELIGMLGEGGQIDPEVMSHYSEGLYLDTELDRAMTMFSFFDNYVQSSNEAIRLVERSQSEILQQHTNLLRKYEGLGAKLLEFDKKGIQKRTPGVVALFDSDDAFQAYLLLSICTSWTGEATWLGDLLREKGYDLTKLVIAVTGIDYRYGISLVDWTNEQAIRCFV